MEFFVYNDDVYCFSCGEKLRNRLPVPQGVDLEDGNTFDSDEYPKGPYSGQEGLADTPQYCAGCGVFLENPLTEDGEDYVRETIAFKNGNPKVRKEWQEFYSYLFAKPEAK